MRDNEAVKALWTATNWVLDPSIVFSFDRTGFRRHARSFEEEDLLADLTGKVCLVTGANSGIGYETSLAFAERGATVWLLCRNPERGEQARKRIVEATGNPEVFLHQVDVSELHSVSNFLSRSCPERVDVLVHNAGVLLREPGKNSAGLELTLATNLVGPTALTAGLLPALQRGVRPRIIWVSSGGMYTQRLSVASLESPPGKFDGVKAYARTKRAMVVLSEQLADRLADSGIAVHCMHPGWADTPGVQHSIPGFWRVTKAILRSPREGADTVIWLGVCDRAQENSGAFWFDRCMRSTHLLWGTREKVEERDALWNAVRYWADLPENWWEQDVGEALASA